MKPQSTDAESSENSKKINDKNKTIPLHLGMSHSNYRKIKDKILEEAKGKKTPFL